MQRISMHYIRMYCITSQSIALHYIHALKVWARVCFGAHQCNASGNITFNKNTCTALHFYSFHFKCASFVSTCRQNIGVRKNIALAIALFSITPTHSTKQDMTLQLTISCRSVIDRFFYQAGHQYNASAQFKKTVGNFKWRSIVNVKLNIILFHQ